MTFDDLHNRYKLVDNNSTVKVDNLYNRFKEGRFKTFQDALACSAAITALNLSGGFDTSSISPEIKEAFELAYPNLDISNVGSYSGNQLDGLIQGWKGKLFEVKVRDNLNNGEWVGDYHLEQGQYAELAVSATQPGWDLQILNSDGSVAELVQLKSTNYISYIESALSKYPEFNVLSTSELSKHEGLVDGLYTSDISNADLESQLMDSIQSDDYGILSLGLPLIPLALNTYRVASGQSTLAEAVGSVAISTASIAGGHLIGGAISSASTGILGDMLVDGVGSLFLDVFCGFGVFTLVKFLVKLGSSEKKKLDKNELEAINKWIEAVNKHIDNNIEAIEQIGKNYPNAAST